MPQPYFNVLNLETVGVAYVTCRMSQVGNLFIKMHSRIHQVPTITKAVIKALKRRLPCYLGRLDRVQATCHVEKMRSIVQRIMTHTL